LDPQQFALDPSQHTAVSNLKKAVEASLATGHGIYTDIDIWLPRLISHYNTHSKKSNLDIVINEWFTWKENIKYNDKQKVINSIDAILKVYNKEEGYESVESLFKAPVKAYIQTLQATDIGALENLKYRLSAVAKASGSKEDVLASLKKPHTLKKRYIPELTDVVLEPYLKEKNTKKAAAELIKRFETQKELLIDTLEGLKKGKLDTEKNKIQELLTAVADVLKTEGINVSTTPALKIEPGSIAEGLQKKFQSILQAKEEDEEEEKEEEENQDWE
jgi:hypothetical protein